MEKEQLKFTLCPVKIKVKLTIDHNEASCFLIRQPKTQKGKLQFKAYWELKPETCTPILYSANGVVNFSKGSQKRRGTGEVWRPGFFYSQ